MMMILLLLLLLLALSFLLLGQLHIDSHDVLLASHRAGLRGCEARQAPGVLHRVMIGMHVQRACTETWEGLLLDWLRFDERGGADDPVWLLFDSCGGRDI